MAQGQPESRKDKSTVIILLVGVLILMVVGYTLWQGGVGGVTDLIGRLLKWAVVLILFGVVIFIVMKILQKPKIDLVENDRKDMIEAGVLSKPPMVKDLYFTGDKEHGEFRVGKIIGYVQLQSYKDLDILAGLTPEHIAELDRQGKVPANYIIKEDVFIFKTLPFPFSFFEEAKVLRTLEDEHSQLIGDVKVYGVSMIKKYSTYFPNRAHLDIARIDIAIIREAWRGQIHQFLRDMVSITQNAVGLDAQYKKELDQRKLLKLPTPLGNQEEGSR
ncbi:hypothetical protein GOV11_03530 [Candidatus Woesearchaeota archaeon]|nr:hypothetical protein [Candidatus Woesearchaeota archaeon]